ncbi:hypothetical protein K435DRAFT_774187 [Dendrothele bispora CBS 962.96]|uniref:Uncharacterized protein n=1 Tax=Dendrothele bispora (strain CBS 962.96) TaxID=1314807 RepID=A0A4S8MQN0_DENBC|nr:hypothetical protein K435DRAFT_774187 [Dendrothele bispora CBS 962.96]
MSSRRLAIANLLNGPQPTTNDDILAEEVVLAPHLRKQPPTPTPAPAPAPAHRYDPVHDLLNVRAKPPSPPPLPQDVDQWLLEQYEPSMHDHHHVEDPDIDHAVSELVDEPPPAPSVLQPDVDDELLSLVDDQPKPAAPPKKPPAKKKAKVR